MTKKKSKYSHTQKEKNKDKCPVCDVNLYYDNVTTKRIGIMNMEGDINEWKEYNVSYDANKSVNTLGLPEGLVVWVDENKFYRKKKTENSLPMFITKRAVIVGDGTALLKGRPNNTAGQVLSFAGKLPVLVKGSVTSGDFLIPVDNEGYCVGISKENTSLKDYFSVMGTALKSCEDIVTLPDDHPSAPGEETDMKLVLCAVGKK